MSLARHVFAPTVRGAVALSQEDFSRKMLALREQHLLTQEEAARLVDVSPRTWARYEDPNPATGNTPRMSTLSTIAEKFGVPVTYFGIDEADPDQLNRIEASLGALSAQLNALSGALADHVAFTRDAVAKRPPTLDLPDTVRRIDDRQDAILQALSALLPPEGADLEQAQQLLDDVAQLLASEAAQKTPAAVATGKTPRARAKRRQSR